MKLQFSEFSSAFLIPVLVLAIAGVGYFLLWPEFTAVRESRDTLSLKEADAQEKQNSFDQVKNLVGDLEDKRDGLSFLDQAVPTSPEIPELLATLEYLATQSGLLIQSIDIKPAATVETLIEGTEVTRVQRQEKLLNFTEKLGIMEINAAVVGQYPQAYAFILNLQQNLRIMDIQGLNITAPKAEDGSQEFFFVIQTYYQRKD